MDRLLLLEDDAGLIDGLQYSLEKNAFALEIARSVQEALRMLQTAEETFDLLILDVTLPDGTGFEVCENVRRSGSRVPILFLTAADEEVSIIRGLDCGGDDYLTKPFRLGELCSRIRALIRRSKIAEKTEAFRTAQNGATEGFLISGPLRIDPLAHKVWKDGDLLELTGAEYRLLYLLVNHRGQILTRNAILDALWDGNGSFVDDNTLSVYIRRLREKVEEDPSNPAYLQTARGLGYQWKEERI